MISFHDLSLSFFAKRLPRLAGTLSLAAVLGFASSCGPENVGGESGKSYTVASPSHPAMNDPVSGKKASTSTSRSDTSLPPGHPPIGDRGSSGTPSGATAERLPEGPLSIAGLRFDVPESWTREAPASRMLSAQYALPRAGDDGVDAELTFSIAGGDLGANVARWEGFFEGAPKAEVETTRIGEYDVALVDIRGTYKRDFRGQSAPLPEFVQHTAIVQTPGGQIFIKALGPQATIEAHRSDLDALVRSIASP